MCRPGNKITLPLLVLIIFGLQIIFYSPESYPQSLMKTADFPGGGSGSPGSSGDTGGSSSALFIIGGVIIAGLLVYEFVVNKDESKKDEKQDSTSNQTFLLDNPHAYASGTFFKDLRGVEQIPVNLSLGIQKVEPGLTEMKFIVGISYNF
jgi:hypothetical protein